MGLSDGERNDLCAHHGAFQHSTSIYKHCRRVRSKEVGRRACFLWCEHELCTSILRLCDTWYGDHAEACVTLLTVLPDLFYNIPYAAKQEGKTVESWVIRQTGIYHQWRNETSASRWLMLNLREPKKRLFWEIFVAPLHCCIVSMHVQLQVIISSDWTSYIEHLTAKLHTMSNKGYYSGFDPNGCEGFSVTNQDVQHLAMFRARIERAMYASESCIEIAEACRVYFQRHTEHSMSQNIACVRCLDLLQKHQYDMAQHRRSLSRLDRRLNMTLDLVCTTALAHTSPAINESNVLRRSPKFSCCAVKRFCKRLWSRTAMHQRPSWMLAARSRTIRKHSHKLSVSCRRTRSYSSCLRWSQRFVCQHP